MDFDPSTAKTQDDAGGGFDPATAQPESAPESKTTASGLVGSFERGAAPYLAGATVGAAAGAPLAGVGAVPGALAGAAAVGLTDLSGAVYNPIARAAGWKELPSSRELTDPLLDKLGIKRPSTDTEKVAEAVGSGVASAVPGPAIAKRVAEEATDPLVKAFAEKLAAKPGKQMISGATGAAAAQTAANVGIGPLGQAVVGMIGGGLPFMKDGAASLAVGGEPKQVATLAHNAGYTLPPGMVTDEPSLLSKVLGGEGGKIKLQQAASVRNQHVTNKLAAEDLGLPSDTVLTPGVFEQVRQRAGETYREIEQTIPEITADPTFRNQVAQVGSKDSVAEEMWPGTMRSPEIISLREELAKHATAPTGSVRQYSAQLRAESNTNLRAVGDPKAHALGLAQRQAADAIEGLIERNVQNAPKYFEDKFASSLEQQSRAADRLREANNRLTVIKATQATNSDIYVSADVMKQERVANEELESAEKSFERAGEQVENWRTRLKTAQDRDTNNQTLMDRFRAARTLMAKSYDVEGATNTATGDVSARGLWHLLDAGKPLTGNLEVIARTAGAFRKAMQNPDMFGHAEDWSALDFFGVSASLIHGNVPVAAAIASRPWVRGTVLSPRYQYQMMHPGQKFVPPPSMLIPPSITTTPPLVEDQQ